MIFIVLKMKNIAIFLITFLHSTNSFPNKNSSLLTQNYLNYGITKLGPCSAKLDDGLVIDLSKN
jgi:hypothetical protein